MIEQFMWKVWCVSFLWTWFIRALPNKKLQEDATWLNRFNDAVFCVWCAAWWQGV